MQFWKVVDLRRRERLRPVRFTQVFCTTQKRRRQVVQTCLRAVRFLRTSSIVLTVLNCPNCPNCPVYPPCPEGERVLTKRNVSRPLVASLFDENLCFSLAAAPARRQRSSARAKTSVPPPQSQTSYPNNSQKTAQAGCPDLPESRAVLANLVDCPNGPELS